MSAIAGVAPRDAAASPHLADDPRLTNEDLAPWNLYKDPAVIHYTLDVLGAFNGPLFGILTCDFYLVKPQHIAVDDLYTMSPSGRYWYEGGYNRKAMAALAGGAVLSILCMMVPALQGAANFTWFIGMAVGLLASLALNR